VPLTAPYQLESLLIEPSAADSEGLPAADHFLQNGLFTIKAIRSPMLMEP
jgi:hypothetical protein